MLDIGSTRRKAGSRAEQRKGERRGENKKNPFVGRVLGTRTVVQGDVLGGGDMDGTGRYTIVKEVQDHHISKKFKIVEGLLVTISHH